MSATALGDGSRPAEGPSTQGSGETFSNGQIFTNLKVTMDRTQDYKRLHRVVSGYISCTTRWETHPMDLWRWNGIKLYYREIIAYLNRKPPGGGFWMLKSSLL